MRGAVGSRVSRHQRYDYCKGDGHVVSQFSRRAAACRSVELTTDEFVRVAELAPDETGKVAGYGYEMRTADLRDETRSIAFRKQLRRRGVSAVGKLTGMDTRSA